MINRFVTWLIDVNNDVQTYNQGGEGAPLEKYLLRMPRPWKARGEVKFEPPWIPKISLKITFLLRSGWNPRKKIGGQNFCPHGHRKCPPPLGQNLAYAPGGLYIVKPLLASHFFQAQMAYRASLEYYLNSSSSRCFKINVLFCLKLFKLLGLLYLPPKTLFAEDHWLDLEDIAELMLIAETPIATFGTTNLFCLLLSKVCWTVSTLAKALATTRQKTTMIAKKLHLWGG